MRAQADEIGRPTGEALTDAGTQTADLVEERERPEADGTVSLAIVELELALDAMPANSGGFAETLAMACGQVGAELLFTLPGAGLTPDFQKVAVVRLPETTDGALALALLDQDGKSISVRLPGEECQSLARFANAFVDVIKRV